MPVKLMTCFAFAAIACAGDHGKLYVTNPDAGVVSVVRLLDRMVVSTIPVILGQQTIAISPDSQYLYVGGSGAVSVIDTRSDHVVATIPLPSSTRIDVAVTTDSRRVYATTYTGVAVIDAQSRSVVTTIVLSGGRIPYGGIAVNPNGKQVYVSTNNTGGAIAVIDTATNTEVANLLGFGAGVAFSPDGSRAYVIGGSFGSGVYIFDTTTCALVGTIGLPTGGQLGIAVSPDGSRLYVSLPHTSFDLGGMAVIDTAHGLVLSTFEVLTQTPPWGGVVVSDTGLFVYTLASAVRTVSIIDSQSNEMVAAIVVGDRPTEMVIKQGGADDSQ